MVLENQDVFLVLHTPSKVSSLAQAHGAKADEWQVVCHHGAGYGVSVGTKVRLAQVEANQFDGLRFERVNPARPGEFMDVVGDWALFYWRLRYTFEKVVRTRPDGTTFNDLAVKERFSFNSRRKALEE